MSGARRGADLGWLFCAALLAAPAWLCPLPAHAISIELNDVAADRIERQRAAADNRLPLPGTPDTGHLDQRLAALGVKPGVPLLIRIFKAQSELELWVQKDNAFVLFATYPICHWSGTVGPKIREGDKQTPEGFYSISSRQLYRMGRWPLALNLGFPNAFDRAHDRSGSYILMHGGCSSVGCVAMTDPVIKEVYGLVKAALRAEQRYIPVHVFPFRMTEENLATHAGTPWDGFWRNLKEGYDSFERTHLPPRISVCENRYRVEDLTPLAPAPPGADGDASDARRILLSQTAVREGCAPAVVATADSKSEALDGQHMSRLGGPMPDKKRKRHHR